MFLFLTFPLDDQFKPCVAILKLISLRFRYFTYLILSNGQFYIPKTLNIQIKKPKKENCGLFHLPLLVHLSVHSPSQITLRNLLDGNPPWMNILVPRQNDH